MSRIVPRVAILYRAPVDFQTSIEYVQPRILAAFQPGITFSHLTQPQESSMDFSGSISSSRLARADKHVMMQALWITVFAVANAVAARVEIPHQPVPYTLQTLVVLLAGAFLGARNGALSQMLYLVIGALGLPVFAAGRIGFAALLGPTGGYLLAFPIAAAVVGYLIHRRRTLAWSFFSMLIGLTVIFTLGTVQLYAVVFKDWVKAFDAGFLIFSWWDILKLSMAAMTYNEVAKQWPRLPNQ
jgi:biotin transport system substrate-specific component